MKLETGGKNRLAHGHHDERTMARETSQSYRQLLTYSVLLTALVSVVPLVLMTGANHRQYWQTMKSEMRQPIARLTSNARMSIEDFIEKHLAALTYLANDRSHDELCDQLRLATTLANLKESFHGFVDIGILDEQGRQSYYAGPYDVKNKDYSGHDWFREVCVKGQYVSDVFLGYRNLPHFIIAVKKSQAGGGRFQALRIIQTQTRFSGNLLERCPLEVPPYSTRTELVDSVDKTGKQLFLGYAYLNQTPFILMVLERQEDVMKNWFSLRNDSILLLVGSVAVLLVVILGGCSYFVNRIREADFSYRRALHNIQYTNKMASIGRLAAGVAHEINNPLAIINENAGLLKDIVSLKAAQPGGHDFVKIANAILKSVTRCKAITHRLLGFAKRMDTTTETIVLETLLREVLGFLGREAEHRNIQVNVTVDADLPQIESDRGQLQQVFLNIVTNAFAAVQDGGKIDISASSHDPGHVAIAISDNGHGISKENLEQIFEPFFTTKQEYGTGLGLSITYGIVQKLGGGIEVESTVGVGTRFTVILPLRNQKVAE
ncbi:MAG: ATP-binding protein [Candidatus Riflebacteria bacterium]|nr:ATP-binding protein [Candidatus Riflebacteria bacterium]